MAKNLIDHEGLIDQDPWTELPDAVLPGADDNVVVSLERWQQDGDAITDAAHRVALRLPNDVDVEELTVNWSAFDMIELVFPKFADGRAYSQARLLRDRLGYKGDLRATGDVLIDQLFFMRRCGFSTFALRDDQNVPRALEKIHTFTVTYQAAADEPRPLFRRRAS